MKAIRTRYLGPSNVKGARIAAFDGDGNRVVIGYDHSLDTDGCHRKAADALCAKMGWANVELVGGWLKNGEHAFVMVSKTASSAS